MTCLADPLAICMVCRQVVAVKTKVTARVNFGVEVKILERRR